MGTLRLFAVLAAFAPCVAFAIPITGADFFGSWTRSKVNDCTLVASNADCSGFLPPIIALPRVDRSFVRAPGLPLTDTQGFATVFSDTTYTGAFDTPVVRASAFSAIDGFGLATVKAYQTYAYNGAAAVDIQFGGVLDFSFSGNSSGTVGNSRSGDGFAFLVVNVFDLAGADYTILDFGGGNTILNVIPGSPALAQAGYSTVGAASPPPDVMTSVPVFSSLTVQPGQELLFEVIFQAAGDRGGYTDASNTFNFGFRNAPDIFFNDLISGTKAFQVPEPGTLALLGLGLASLGLARRRKKV